MYLAALVGQNPYVSTYFIAILDPVGGGGTHKKAHVENAGKKAKSEKHHRFHRRFRCTILMYAERPIGATLSDQSTPTVFSSHQTGRSIG